MGDSFLWGASYPPPTQPATGSQRQLLQDVDPALHFALLYWSTALDSYLTPRIAATGAIANAGMQRAVNSVMWTDPGPFLTDTQTFVPACLAAFRVESAINNRTMKWEQAVSQWDVLYILPSMAAGPAKWMAPLLTAAAKVLTTATTRGHDSSFMSGARVWTPPYANVDAIGFRRWQFGQVVQDSSGRTYHGLRARCEVTERVHPLPPTPGLPAFSAEVHAGQVSDTDPFTTPDDVVADLDPTSV